MRSQFQGQSTRFSRGPVRRLRAVKPRNGWATCCSQSGNTVPGSGQGRNWLARCAAAHLASQLRPWPEPGTVFPDWEQQVAQPFRGFTARNLRTGPLLKRVLWPWNWLRISTAVEALAARYETDLTGLRLPELPQRPVFLFCATDMAFGVNWVFSQERIGDYQAGYLSPAPDWSVARAVAASSCFPPVFDPLAAGLRPEQLAGGDAQGRPNRNT